MIHINPRRIHCYFTDGVRCKRDDLLRKHITKAAFLLDSWSTRQLKLTRVVPLWVNTYHFSIYGSESRYCEFVSNFNFEILTGKRVNRFVATIATFSFEQVYSAQCFMCDMTFHNAQSEPLCDVILKHLYDNHTNL